MSNEKSCRWCSKAMHWSEYGQEYSDCGIATYAENPQMGHVLWYNARLNEGMNEAQIGAVCPRYDALPELEVAG